MPLDPTMESYQSNQELQHQYDALVQQLNSINPSRKPRTLSWSHTDSTRIIKELAELEESPRSLMHSLQGPLRKYDLAVFTPLRERREAIESGRLKGRKLFDRQEEHDHFMVVETEVRSVFSYDSDDNETSLQNSDCHSLSSSNSSFVCEERIKRELHAVEEQEEKKAVMEKDRLRVKTVKERRWTLMVLAIWLAIGVVMVAFGFFSVRFLASHRRRGDIILVPT